MCAIIVAVFVFSLEAAKYSYDDITSKNGEKSEGEVLVEKLVLLLNLPCFPVFQTVNGKDLS